MLPSLNGREGTALLLTNCFRSVERIAGREISDAEEASRDRLHYASPRSTAAVSTIDFPMLSDAVAAGDGTLRTCSILPDVTN